MFKAGQLVSYYDQPALIVREVVDDDIEIVYGKNLESDMAWTFRSGILKYWIILFGEETYLVKEDNLKPL